MKKTKFFGKQLSRLRMGQSYYNIIVSTMSVVSLLKLAFDLDVIIMLIVFPLFLFSAFLIGYVMDKLDIHSIDFLKTNEMNYRFLTTGELKFQEFTLLQTEMLLDGLKKMQEGKPIDTKMIAEKYKKYYDKWKVRK